jgi:hypothetical protein
MSVMEYANKFNHLAQYAGTHVDTDEKKRDRLYRRSFTLGIIRLLVL